MADTHPSAVRGVFKRPYAEQVAFFRQKLRDLRPTARWDDLWKSEHDKAFMVAGAAKADLLSDLAVAVDRAITEGKSLEAFRKDFAAIVQRHGWTDYTGEFGWRTRIILTTNASTSYAAGRLAQLREGGFELWVYRHSDSVLHPRPHHVALNGLALPPDHPFWTTHYPPNGWGCRCYVVGARDADGASLLGGDPGKRLPAGWNTVDSRTGEPVGVDKGWGYMPGATVADDVRQMAEKTVQWQYALAKAYMQGLPESLRDSLARSYRDLPSVADEVRRYAARVLDGRTHLDIPEYQALGLLTGLDVQKVRDLTGRNVTGFDYALDRYAPLHVRRKHSDQRVEGGRGQRVVSVEDYARIPAVLNEPDVIRSDEGAEEIIYEKWIGNERYVVIFAPLMKRKMLSLKSMRIHVASPRPTS